MNLWSQLRMYHFFNKYLDKNNKSWASFTVTKTEDRWNILLWHWTANLLTNSKTLWFPVCKSNWLKGGFFWKFSILIGWILSTLPVHDGPTRRCCVFLLETILSFTGESRSSVATAKMKHYEVSCVYESQNHQWLRFIWSRFNRSDNWKRFVCFLYECTQRTWFYIHV